MRLLCLITPVHLPGSKAAPFIRLAFTSFSDCAAACAFSLICFVLLFFACQQLLVNGGKTRRDMCALFVMHKQEVGESWGLGWW